jgi:predicted hotdog family 3-hydroxylacyl-ACP dehydratase
MPSTKHHYTPAELLPISGDIMLLDAIRNWGHNWLEAEVTHRQPSLFSEADGSVPNWVGLEYMAQAIGALIGIRNVQAGDGRRIGFLLGSRKYQSYARRFDPGVAVIIRVDELLWDKDNLGIFNCTIRSDTLLAEASVKMLQPEHPEAILEASQPI